MKTLYVIIGPTGVGKTETAIELAEHFGSPILNADSRQMYRDLPIGTSAPTQAQQARVRHYFVGTLSLNDYYSAARYEEDSLAILEREFQMRDDVVMCGGSMLYIDAVCKGIDEIPTVDAETRALVRRRYAEEGLDSLVAELRLLDPEYYRNADIRNTARILHALEVCYMTGRPFSSFHTSESKRRPFRIVKIGLRRERAELFQRISLRTDKMIADGLLEEARRVLPYRSENSLNTVGYKELFRYFDGEWSLDFAIEKIKRNTRVYAKKQMTWWAKDSQIQWYEASQFCLPSVIESL